MSTAPGVGVEFAGYSIERLLGRGGGGLVYLAKDLRLSRHVALKILSAEFADDPRFRERFVRESRLAASIDHHNIIPIFAADEVDGILYIAMRYVAGTDLRKLLVEEGKLDAERALAIVAQVGDALDAAHAQDLVHRDVKPGNVLIVPRLRPGGVDHAYLADFGITKRMTTDHSLTTAGQFVGTTDYVAPEQIMGGAIDGRADIYSLGCVLYQCLAGVPPFERDSDVAVIYAHLSDPRPPLTAHRPDLPPAMDEVMATAMAKAPDDRYPTASAFVAAARAALRGDERHGATTVSSTAAPTQVVQRRPADPIADQPSGTIGWAPVHPPAGLPTASVAMPVEPATQTALHAPPASPPQSPPFYAPVVTPAPLPARPRFSTRVAITAVALVIAVLGVVLAVVVSQHRNSTSSNSTASAPPPSPGGLPAMLLTAADFPAGTVSPLSTDLRLAQIRCGTAPVAEVEERNIAFQDQGASTGSGYFYFQAAASFNTAADASAYLDQVDGAGRSCAAQLTPARAAPQLGDRTVRVMFHSGDGQITYDAVYILKGKVVSLVLVSVLGTAQPPADKAERYAGIALKHMTDNGA